MGISARRAAPRSFWISEIGPSRSQASGDSGSVNPNVMSMTTRTGRRPKPPRSPNPRMWAKTLASVSLRLTELSREPLVERATSLGDHTPLLFEGRQVPTVESRRVAPASLYLLAFGRCGPRVDGTIVADYNAVEVLGGLGAYEAPADVFGYGLGIAFQRVPDAASPGRLEDEAVALEDGHIAYLGRHLDLFATCPDEGLLGGRAWFAAAHTIRICVGTVVLVGYAAVGEEAVDLLDAASATELAGAARVSAGRVLLYDHRVVRLHVLRRDREELRPPGVSIQAVLARDGGYPAVEYLHGLETLATVLDARVDEVGARAVGA